MAAQKPSQHVRSGLPSPDGTTGETLWETGGWSETGQGLSGEPIPIKGYWGAVKVRQGEDWKIRMMTVNVTPAPAQAATPR